MTNPAPMTHAPHVYEYIAGYDGGCYLAKDELNVHESQALRDAAYVFVQSVCWDAGLTGPDGHDIDPEDLMRELRTELELGVWRWIHHTSGDGMADRARELAHQYALGPSPLRAAVYAAGATLVAEMCDELNG